MYQTSDIKASRFAVQSNQYDPSAQDYELDVSQKYKPAYDQAAMILVLQTGPFAARTLKTRDIDSRILALMFVRHVNRKKDDITFRSKDFRSLVAKSIKNPNSCVNNSLKRLHGLNFVNVLDATYGNVWSLNTEIDTIRDSLDRLSSSEISVIQV